jgi:hypothetical protein
VRRAVAVLCLAACASAALACGKYGPPLRAEQKAEPVQTEEPSEAETEEATP